MNHVISGVNIDWYEKLETYKDDANNTFIFFYWQMNHLLDKYMPWKKLSKKVYKSKYKPWISGSSTELRRNIRRLRNTGNDYKRIKNEITDLTKKGKKEYYNRYVRENKSSMQKIWKGIIEVIDIKSKVYNSPSSIESDGKTVSEPREIAASFNSYFTNVTEDFIRKRKYNGKISHNI